MADWPYDDAATLKLLKQRLRVNRAKPETDETRALSARLVSSIQEIVHERERRYERIRAEWQGKATRPIRTRTPEQIIEDLRRRGIQGVKLWWKTTRPA